MHIEYMEMHTNASAILGPNDKIIGKWMKNRGFCVFVRLKLVFGGVLVACNQIPSAGIEFKHQVKNSVAGDHYEHISPTFSFPTSARIFNAEGRSVPYKLEWCYMPKGVKMCSNFNFFHRDFSVNIQLTASMYALQIVLYLLTGPPSKSFARLIHHMQY